MKPLLSGRSAAAIVFLALGTRASYAIAIDGPQLLNAGWITFLMAAIGVAPLAFSMDFLENAMQKPAAEFMKGAWVRVYSVVLALFALYETGCGIFLLSGSASYLAYETISAPVMFIVCGLTAAAGCMIGSEAVAGAARIALRLFAIAVVFVVFSQMSSYNWRWLTPVFGPGLKVILPPALSVSGMLTGMIPLWLFTDYNNRYVKRGYMKKILLAITGYGVMVSLLFAMLLPAMPKGPMTRWFQLERLLANGRTPQALQVIMIPAWFSLLLVSLSFNMLCATEMLGIAFPSTKPIWRIGICLAAILAISFSPLGTRPYIELINLIRWPVCSIPLLIYALIIAAKKRKAVSPA